MGVRFRKSIKLGKNTRINLNKKSVSFTTGVKGAHHTVSSSGRKTTSVDLPGGFSYRSDSGGGKKSTGKAGAAGGKGGSGSDRGKPGCGCLTVLLGFLGLFVVFLMVISLFGGEPSQETASAETKIAASSAAELSEEIRQGEVDRSFRSDEKASSVEEEKRAVSTAVVSEADLLPSSSGRGSGPAGEGDEKVGSGTAAGALVGLVPVTEDRLQAVEGFDIQENTEGDHTVTEEAGTSAGDTNFNTYDNKEQEETEDSFVLNTSSMKIHHPWCSSVAKIAPQNYETSSETIEELEAKGYSLCGSCFR